MSEITVKVSFDRFTPKKICFTGQDENGNYSVSIYVAKTVPIVDLPSVIKLELDPAKMAD